MVIVSPSHVPFEGTTKDKKNMTGHSVAAWRGRDIPFVKPDFGKVKMSKYYRYSAAKYKVMGMYGCIFSDAVCGGGVSAGQTAFQVRAQRYTGGGIGA